MLRNGRQTHRETGREIAHRQLPAGESQDDRASRRIRQGPERGVQMLNHTVKYMELQGAPQGLRQITLLRDDDVV